MTAAHNTAESIRNNAGYSGGIDGSAYIVTVNTSTSSTKSSSSSSSSSKSPISATSTGGTTYVKNTTTVSLLAVSPAMPELLSSDNKSADSKISYIVKNGVSYANVRELFPNGVSYDAATNKVRIEYKYNGNTYTIANNINDAKDSIATSNNKDVIINAYVTAPNGEIAYINVLYSNQKTYIDNFALYRYVGGRGAGSGGSGNSSGSSNTGSQVVGREVIIPDTVNGIVDGKNVTLYPKDNWFSYQGNAPVIDDNGRYKVVVGPKY